MSKTIKVFLVDDHKIYLESMAMLLNTIESITLVGVAADADEVLRKIIDSEAEILLCDYYMPKIDGVELIFKLRTLNPAIKVLMLTSREDADGIKQAIQAGAKGFLSKRVSKDELIKAISTIAEGYHYYSELVIKELANNQPETAFLALQTITHETLTTREIEVIKLIAQEMTGKRIAENLHLSTNTIASHRKNIFQKLGINTTSALVKYAIEHRLI